MKYYFETEEAKRIEAELDADMKRRLQAADDKMYIEIGKGLLQLFVCVVTGVVLGLLIKG